MNLWTTIQNRLRTNRSATPAEKRKKPSDLIELAINGRYREERESAIRNLTKQNDLAAVALGTKTDFFDRPGEDGGYTWWPDVVRRIDDPLLLLEIAKRAPVGHLRAKAVEKIVDQDILRTFATRDGVAKVRASAVRKLSDQSVLAKIAYCDRDFEVRITAIRRIKDQVLLAEICMNDTKHEVKEAALRQITDDGLIEEIAAGEGKYAFGLRMAAVDKISNPMFLTKLAKSEIDLDVGMRALMKLSEISLISDIADNASRKQIRWAAKIRLGILELDSIGAKNQEAMREIALMDPWKLTNIFLRKIFGDDGEWSALKDFVSHYRIDISSDLSQRSIELLSDPDMLVEVALDDNVTAVNKVAAVKKLSSNDRLAEIARKGRRNQKIRVEAILRISDRTILEDIKHEIRTQYFSADNKEVWRNCRDQREMTSDEYRDLDGALEKRLKDLCNG